MFSTPQQLLSPLIDPYGQYNSPNFDHGMNGKVIDSDVAPNLFHSSSIDQSAVTDQPYEMAQTLIKGMLAHQIIRWGEAGMYCILCVLNLKNSITWSLVASEGSI